MANGTYDGTYDPQSEDNRGTSSQQAYGVGGYKGQGQSTKSGAVVSTPGSPPPTNNGNGGKKGDGYLLPEWARGGYKKWAPKEWGVGRTGGGGGGGGGGNVAKTKDFTFDKIGYDPYKGEDIRSKDRDYERFDKTAGYDPYMGSYEASRFDRSTDPFRGDKFAAPSYQQAQEDPGYQFRLRQGQQALENSAAAKGMLRTGGTMKGLMDYNQAAASQEYDKAYGRALGEYQMGYGQDATADQQQWAREAQKFGMNRQAALDQYDRDFQRHQVNQAGRAGVFGQQMGAHQMDQQGLYQAQQANLGNQIAARQSNLGMYGQNLAAQQGAWDRMYMGGKDQYGYGLDRARHLDAEAQASADRGQRASDQAYNRARADYLLGYQQDVYGGETRWGRLEDLKRTPTTTPSPND